MLNSLRGKTAVITGGSRGIGLAIAQNFARQGANTIIVGRNIDTLNTALKSIRAAAAGAELPPSPPSPPRPSANTINNNNAAAEQSEDSATTNIPSNRTFSEAIQTAINTIHQVEAELQPKAFPPEKAAISTRNVDKTTSAYQDDGPSNRISLHRATFHEAFQGDVSIPGTWSSLSQKLSQGGFGKQARGPADSNFVAEDIHTLVNCAGIAQYAFHHMTPDEDYANILDINLRSVMLGCKYMGKYMHKRRVRHSFEGTGIADAQAYSIINVSSIMAWRGGYGAAAYAASKAGILGLTSALAEEFGAVFGIRVNAIVPGYIDTKMTKGKCAALVYCSFLS